MSSGRIIAAAAVLALMGSGTAYAQSTQRTSVPADENQWSVQGSRQTLRWDDNRRWGLRVGPNQPVSERDARDVEAGAFLRITPSLRVGGAVRLNEETERSERLDALNQRERSPRVRLETRFRF